MTNKHIILFCDERNNQCTSVSQCIDNRSFGLITVIDAFEGSFDE